MEPAIWAASMLGKLPSAFHSAAASAAALPSIIAATKVAPTNTSPEPVAFTGEKDFHALTAGADDTVYGLATDDTDLLRSVDAGATWTPTGAQVPAVSLTADASGRVVAATADGVTVSTDRGASFSAWPDAPLLYTLGASPDRKRLVGVGTDDRIWVLGSGEDQWREAGTVHEQAQAVGIDADGRVVVVDASGITVLPQ